MFLTGLELPRILEWMKFLAYNGDISERSSEQTPAVSDDFVFSIFKGLLFFEYHHTLFWFAVIKPIGSWFVVVVTH